MQQRDKTIVTAKEGSSRSVFIAGFLTLLGFLLLPLCQTALAQSPISVSATVEGPGGNNSGGGGGGGNSPGPTENTLPIPASVVIAGFAYRNASMTIFQGGQEIENLVANPDASFSVTLVDITPGVHNFSVLGEDSAGRRSSLLNFTITVEESAQVEVSNIFLPPTLSIPKREIMRLGSLQILGESVPGSEVSFWSDSNMPIENIGADALGKYLSTTPLGPQLLDGSYTIKAKSRLPNGIESSYGTLATFFVGSGDAELLDGECGIGDYNCDGGINILDFSILAYWFRLGNPPAEIDLTNDGKITVEDFSILAYYWSR